MAVERLNFLRRQGVSEGLLRGVEDFCRAYEGQKTETDRVQKPEVLFYGREILEELLTRWEEMGYSFGSLEDLVTNKNA